MAKHRKRERGQATVEAAVLIPILFLILLMLVQPAILLYTHMVMKGAASEGCRLLATRTSAGEVASESYHQFILHRLGSVPSQDNFHIHSAGCSWEIELEGDETTQEVAVTISNKVKLLPLFDAAYSLLGLADAEGYFVQQVSVSQVSQPAWVTENELGLNPEEWVYRWQ